MAGTSIALGVLLILGAAQEEKSWITDPSSEPIQMLESFHTGERYRIRCDFNDDGIEDMALSYDIGMFGNAGGNFTLYLGNGEGKFREHGSFFAYPGVLALEVHLDAIRLWLYHGLGGTEGELGYHVITEEGIREFTHLRVYPHVGFTSVSNAILEAVFNNTDKPIFVERSTTVDGEVTWAEHKTILPPKVKTKIDSGVEATKSPDQQPKN